MKFKVNGNEVFASTGGRPFDKKKPLIIFVHGSGLTHMTWVLQARYFAFHGYNSLAVDLPGHGLSSGESLKSIEEMADWVNSVIDAVGHKEASLVGHSQGCLVTVECTSRYPDKIKTLSLMGGAGLEAASIWTLPIRMQGLGGRTSSRWTSTKEAPWTCTRGTI